MAGKKRSNSIPMMSSPENVEQEMIALAVNQARKQLLEGVAPASTVNYYLKLAGTRETLERDILSKQAALLEAKANNINNSEDEKQAYLDAIDAIKNYQYTKVN